MTLVNGERRYLSRSYSPDSPAHAINCLRYFSQRKGEFANEWLETELSTVIARAHIAEVGVAQVPPDEIEVLERRTRPSTQ